MILSSSRLFRFALLLIIISAVIALHFSGEPYRYDEAWFVGAANTSASLLPFPTVIRIWVSAFATSSVMTRWLSDLFLLLGLAVVSRLSISLYDRRIMWFVLVLLGTLAIWNDFSGRADTYALSVALASALYLFFWRWIRTSNWLYMGGYFGGAILMALTYPVGLSIIVLQLVFTALIVHQPRKLLLPCLALLAGGVTSILVGLQGDNIVMAIDRSLLHFSLPIQMQPGDNIQLLLLIGLGGVGLVFDWQERTQRALYLTIMIGGGVLISAIIGPQINLLFLDLPLLVVLAAHGLMLAVRPVRFVLTIIYLLLALILLGVSRLDMPNYPQVVAYLSPDKGIVISAPNVWQQAANLFYIHEKIPNATVFHILKTSNYSDMRFLPVALSNVVGNTDETGVQNFTNWAAPYDEILLIEDGMKANQAKLYSEMFKPFVAYTVNNWSGERATDKDQKRITRFLRIPQNLQNQFAFGDQLWLQSWVLKNDVNARACQTITVQSWWQLQKLARDNYSLSLTLSSADNGQGAAHVDSALGEAETLLWETGQSHFDERMLTIPCDLASGNYNLLFSVYSSKNNIVSALDAALPDGSPLGKQLYLTTLHIQSAS
jgi:hypothetical protein